MTRDETIEAVEAAIDAAYRATPNGEGLGMTLYSAAVAAVAVCLDGAHPAQAARDAIGPRGTYGKRRLAIIPKPLVATHNPNGDHLVLTFRTEADLLEAMKELTDDV